MSETQVPLDQCLQTGGIRISQGTCLNADVMIRLHPDTPSQTLGNTAQESIPKKTQKNVVQVVLSRFGDYRLTCSIASVFSSSPFDFVSEVFLAAFSSVRLLATGHVQATSLSGLDRCSSLKFPCRDRPPPICSIEQRGWPVQVTN